MKILNQNEFDETIKQGTTLVDFFADWCGPCKMLAPVLESVASQYPNIEFVKVNVDDCMEIAERYQIMSIPTLYLFQDGQLIKKMSGYTNADGIKKFIEG